MSELSAEAEAIAQGVEAREAELDAMEADPDMVGSDAWQEAQRDAQADGYADDDDGRIFSRYEEHEPEAGHQPADDCWADEEPF